MCCRKQRPQASAVTATFPSPTATQPPMLRQETAIPQERGPVRSETPPPYSAILNEKAMAEWIDSHQETADEQQNVHPALRTSIESTSSSISEASASAETSSSGKFFENTYLICSNANNVSLGHSTLYRIGSFIGKVQHKKHALQQQCQSRQRSCCSRSSSRSSSQSS